MRTPRQRGQCVAPNCLRESVGSGLCGTHLQRKRRGQPMEPLIRKLRRVRPPCELPGCSKPYWAKGLCATHWKRKDRGDPDWSRPILDKAKLVPFPNLRIHAEVEQLLTTESARLRVNRSAMVRMVLKQWAVGLVRLPEDNLWRLG